MSEETRSRWENPIWSWRLEWNLPETVADGDWAREGKFGKRIEYFL